MRQELHRKEQDLVQMQAKMKTVEEQHADYQRHIAVLKESLIAKEEHYNMLQIDVSVEKFCFLSNSLSSPAAWDESERLFLFLAPVWMPELAWVINGVPFRKPFRGLFLFLLAHWLNLRNCGTKRV